MSAPSSPSASPSPSSFLVADEGPVRWITIHRPEARGALHLEGRNELVALLADADNDEAVRCLVLTGTDPAFSAGVDLKERNPLTPQDRRFRVNPGKALRALRTPVICAVNGSCVTGGLEMALSCHFVIASSSATFVDTHAKVGILPGWGLSALLPRAVGLRMARQLSITGARIDAGTALRIGLVNEVVAHEALGARVREIAEQVLTCDDRAVRDLLQLYARGDGATLAEALALEEDALVNRVNTAASDRRVPCSPARTEPPHRPVGHAGGRRATRIVTDPPAADGHPTRLAPRARLARSVTADVVDGHVALVAGDRGGEVITCCVAELGPLVPAIGGPSRVDRARGRLSRPGGGGGLARGSPEAFVGVRPGSDGGRAVRTSGRGAGRSTSARPGTG